MKRTPYQQAVLQQWERVASICTGPENQMRLNVLRRQMDLRSGKDAASSYAEIETAHFLMEAGFSVAFLEAEAGRTADLQCYAEGHRFFVEITVIQSTQTVQGSRGGGLRASHEVLRETGDDFFEQAFVRRLLARMAEKAKQLVRYCAPVLLAVTVPDVPSDRSKVSPLVPLDLQRIAGMVVGVLAEVPQFSGVLLTFWNAPAQVLRNPIRIREVKWVTRPKVESQQPRIRLLATNRFASYRLTDTEVHLLKAAL